ncbi:MULTISPECIES: sensor histidine kinase [Clostridium]|uniref:sensor histidine kinase n=1 Tax=Clostridium TaxID=1485 RepID=UPI0022DFF4DD|nr:MULTISPECIES: sensor histidine kinase [Clostridium]MDU1278171.1 sensor histidine kinase [Clostridium sp.]MDU3526345.1 sensor histidine kinase [Clostridium sp.]MDU3548532.1 sensor histidine kinase [Clostridium sp.]MDU4736486.1 sensor histidine kinase [Clostridium sp.]MDU6363869.1 sensor histidine kinase [Clostridium sp.]
MIKGKKVFKVFKYLNIRTSILMSYSILIITTLLVISFISIRYTENTVKNNSVDYTTKIIKQINNDIDSYIISMDNISTLVSKNSEVQEYLFDTEENINYQFYNQKILELFETVRETREDICNIAIISKDDKYIINDGKDELSEYISIKDVSWYKSAVLKNGDTFVSSSHVQNVIKDSYKWVITLCRTLINPNTNEQEGVFFIDLNYNAISDLCEKNALGKRGYVFIIDENGNIIYHPKQQLIYSGLLTENIEKIISSDKNYFVTDLRGDSCVYTFSKSEKTGWTVVGVSYMDELIENNNEMILVYIVVISIILGLAILISMIISKEITMPLKILKNYMKEVEKGNFEAVNIEVTGENEIGSLSNSFNIMISEIKKLMEQNINEQKQKRKSEIKALQAQINPHFLYNTLDSIIWMAECNRTNEVVIMTSSLAKLLRESISNEEEITTIEREINYVKSYLTIQKMRYKDKLEFKIDIEKSIYNVTIIKLILQPIVENAIYHGIKYKEGKNLISIEGYNLGNEVEILIKDTGIGMEKYQIENILTPNKRSKKSNGVGIYNVQMRLQLTYGKEYGLFYESIKSEGTTVKIRIPKRGEIGYEE